MEKWSALNERAKLNLTSNKIITNQVSTLMIPKYSVRCRMRLWAAQHADFFDICSRICNKSGNFLLNNIQSSDVKMENNELIAENRIKPTQLTDEERRRFRIQGIYRLWQFRNHRKISPWQLLWVNKSLQLQLQFPIPFVFSRCVPRARWWNSRNLWFQQNGTLVAQTGPKAIWAGMRWDGKFVGCRCKIGNQSLGLGHLLCVSRNGNAMLWRLEAFGCTKCKINDIFEYKWIGIGWFWSIKNYYFFFHRWTNFARRWAPFCREFPKINLPPAGLSLRDWQTWWPTYQRGKRRITISYQIQII